MGVAGWREAIAERAVGCQEKKAGGTNRPFLRQGGMDAANLDGTAQPMAAGRRRPRSGWLLSKTVHPSGTGSTPRRRYRRAVIRFPLALENRFAEPSVLRGKMARWLEAGLLTSGSSLRLRLPGDFCPLRQWPDAAFVPGYSGGTAPDFHGIPFARTRPNPGNPNGASMRSRTDLGAAVKETDIERKRV